MSVEVTTLKSGITVVTDTMPHLETASLGVWVAAGSRNERINEHGISHLLEHMAFKGTRRRSARQIAEEIEAVGGDLNAATGAESTAYYARVLRDDVPLALDVLADILSDPTFDGEELHREQNVIVQEIGAAADTPDDLIFEHLNTLAFPDQPLGRSILGTAKTVRSFNGAALRDYLTRNYRAPNMVVAAAGAVDHAAVVADVERRFSSFAGPANLNPEPGRFGGGTHIEQRELEQVHIAMALPGVPVTDPTLYSLQVFANILGGGMSSRLFQEAREQPRPVLFDLFVPHALFRRRHVRSLCRHRFRRHFRADARHRRRDRKLVGDRVGSRSGALQGADEGRSLDGAGKLRRAHRATGATDDHLGPADPGRRTGREGRRCDGRVARVPPAVPCSLAARWRPPYWA